jgi:hypothetical protein
MEEEEAHLFQVTSKTHMALHCALLSKHINPRVVWCFSGEDMMYVTHSDIGCILRQRSARSKSSEQNGAAL